MSHQNVWKSGAFNLEKIELGNGYIPKFSIFLNHRAHISKIVAAKHPQFSFI